LHFGKDKGDRTLGKIRAIALWEEMGDRTLGRKGRSHFGKKRAIVLLGISWRSLFNYIILI